MAVERKLKYCPLCGSFVKFDYSNGAWVDVITWRCTKKDCYFSKQDMPLRIWNARWRPSRWTRIMEIVNRIHFWLYGKWADHKIKKAFG